MQNPADSTAKDTLANLNIPSNFNLAFSDYITQTQQFLTQHRPPFALSIPQQAFIIEQNSPYELIPDKPTGVGALLLHGLLDCPFSLRETANHLSQHGVHCRSILLPGHGTRPEHLLTVSYHDWLQAVRYGIESFAKTVDRLYIVGYSTGAALAIYHALQLSNIAGLVLLAPAIKIKEYISVLLTQKPIMHWGSNHKLWVFKTKETDYVKYHSMCLNAALQVELLTHAIEDLQAQHRLTCPIFLAVSRQDETISAHAALDFFQAYTNPKSHCLLYSELKPKFKDSRIQVLDGQFKQLNINHLSHICIPYSQHNFHYGVQGDYPGSSKTNTDYTYGAYNFLQVKAYDLLHRCGLATKRYKELTYNPDFARMVTAITEFVRAPL